MASGKPDDVLQQPASSAILVGIRWQSHHHDETMTLSYIDRQVTQPGPAAAERIDSIASTAVPLSFTLEPGLTLREAIAGPLLAAGIVSASVRLDNVQLAPFHYVRPALSATPDHAAYYSEQFSSPAVRMVRANATFGSKDGAPFVHCHAWWEDAAGNCEGGHVLTDLSLIAAPVAAMAWGSRDVAMQVDYDPETNFSLFHPLACAAPATATAVEKQRRSAVARIRPNQDLSHALEEICARHGFDHAVIRGSLGSIVGAVFDDGRIIPERATEILVENGRVDIDAAGTLMTTLDIFLIDIHGAVHRGRLARGCNPVLICFELVLEEVPDQAH